VLCVVLLPEPIGIVMAAVAEAAGSSSSVGEDRLAQCREAIEPTFKAQDCQLIELAMLKLGRTYTVVAYVEPSAPINAVEVDALRVRLEQQVQATLQAPVLAEVIPTATHPYADAQS
jgi:predicted Co/Zn/Cd cation transporter (cation efflux family)